MRRFGGWLFIATLASMSLSTHVWGQEEDELTPPPPDSAIESPDTDPYADYDDEVDSLIDDQGDNLDEIVPDDQPIDELVSPAPADEEAVENTDAPSPPPGPPGRLPDEGDAKQPPSYKISVDAIININYTFLNGVDKFKVRYAVNLSDILKPRMTKVRGNASISTDISGTLAKWPGGECALAIATDAVPFEISVTPASGIDRQMAIKFNRGISENWQSKCSFVDDPDAHFNTSAGGEKWVENALRKTSPLLNQLSATFNQTGSSTLTFFIEKQKVVEEGIGSADVDGTGIISIEPVAAEKS